MNETCEVPESLQTGEVRIVSEELSALYTAHSRAIYYLALRFLGDPQKAEDATHDVFLKALRKFDQFRRRVFGADTGFYRIAINHCRNLQQTWHERHMFPNSDNPVWEHAAAGESPLRILETKELGARIQKTLDGLPPEYKLLLLLVSDQELSYEQVGALTEQTSDAVRGKLHRARKAFAALFAKSE